MCQLLQSFDEKYYLKINKGKVQEGNLNAKDATMHFQGKKEKMDHVRNNFLKKKFKNGLMLNSTQKSTRICP